MAEHISDREKRQNDQLHFDQLLELQRIDVKSGKIRDRVRNSGQFSVPNDLIFFQDRLEKFRTVTLGLATTTC